MPQLREVCDFLRRSAHSNQLIEDRKHPLLAIVAKCDDLFRPNPDGGCFRGPPVDGGSYLWHLCDVGWPAVSNSNVAALPSVFLHVGRPGLNVFGRKRQVRFG